MGVLETLRKSIGQIGVKEIARRSGLSPSTVSRVNAGLIEPSFAVADKISRAAGFQLDLHPIRESEGYRFDEVARRIRRLHPTLQKLGVKHVTVFGSVARGEARPDSDIDLYIDYGTTEPDFRKVLKAEGRILEAFDGTKVDFVNNLTTPKGQKLKIQIDRDGQLVF